MERLLEVHRGASHQIDTTPTGSRMICVTRFLSIEAVEQSATGMEEGLRAAMPQLDALLADRTESAARA